MKGAGVMGDVLGWLARAVGLRETPRMRYCRGPRRVRLDEPMPGWVRDVLDKHVPAYRDAA